MISTIVLTKLDLSFQHVNIAQPTIVQCCYIVQLHALMSRRGRQNRVGRGPHTDF